MNFKTPIFAGIAALSLIACGAFAQVKKPAAKPATTKGKTTTAQAKPAALPTDPEVIVGKLPNGLTYYIRSNANPKNRAYVVLINKAGSLQEADGQQGLAHLTQRMVFNGTRGFSKDDIAKFLGKGARFGSDINGNTSFDQTILQVVLPTDTAAIFNKGFSLLAELADGATLDAAEVDKEKAALLKEAEARAPQEQVQQQTYSLLFNNSKYAQHNPAGKADAIKNLTPAMVKNFYHDWYRPNLQAVIAIGNFDSKAVEQLIKNNFSAFKNPVPEKPATTVTVPPALGTTIKVSVDNGLSDPVVQMIVRHPETVIKNQADMLRDMRVNLFNMMINTRIGETMKEKNAPFGYAQVSYGPYIGRQDALSAIVQGKTGAENEVKGLVNELERAKRFGFTLTELERAKQASLQQMENMYSTREQANSSAFLSQYIKNFTNGDAIPGINYSYNFYVNNIGKISIADMQALATQVITDQNRVIMVTLPEAEKDKLPTEKNIQDWAAQAEKDAKPYSDALNTEPLMAMIPQKGSVVKQEADSVISTTRLTLSNGVKVILKPTKFQGNQILINAYAFGGTSLASDQDYLSVSVGAGVIANSGVADLDAGQLSIKLRNAQANVKPYISDIAQGISGNSSTADFETAMQLIYLYFTQPRKDAELWQSTISQTRSLLAGKGADPGSVYQDTVTALLNSHVARAMPTTPAQIDAASLDKAYGFYKARFADASNFTFVFAGNFTNDKIIPYIETYLGSLPSTHQNETFKNTGAHPVAGQVTRTVYKGTSDKATVQLVFSGPYDYSEANNIQMDALDDILDRKLKAAFPEKTSGAYSMSAGINYVKLPEKRYKATISFLCAVPDVDKITNGIMGEIAKIRLNGADTTSINRFIAIEARNIQTQLRQNYFWAGYLLSSDQDGDDPDRIIPHIQSLYNVTPASTKETANKYLGGTNLIKLILLPEKEKK